MYKIRTLVAALLILLLVHLPEVLAGPCCSKPQLESIPPIWSEDEYLDSVMAGCISEFDLGKMKVIGRESRLLFQSKCGYPGKLRKALERLRELCPSEMLEREDCYRSHLRLLIELSISSGDGVDRSRFQNIPALVMRPDD